MIVVLLVMVVVLVVLVVLVLVISRRPSVGVEASLLLWLSQYQER